MKGMANTFPSRRPSVPTWELDVVLDFITVKSNSLSKDIKFMTKKCLFLTLLAMGSRASEVFALRRDQGFFKCLPSGALELSADPAFLAKNESPLSRRAPTVITPLGNTSKESLCPVNTIHQYLSLTNASSETDMFVHPSSLKKWSLAAMKCSVCSLIKEAQPSSMPRAHDIRKIATTLAFLNGMTVPELKKRTGWRSTNVFIKHYLKKLEEVASTCTIMGQVLSPKKQI